MKEEMDKVYAAFDKKRFIKYHPGLVPLCGSAHAALMLAWLIYWNGQGKNRHYIYKTIKEMEAETGLTLRNQQSCINKLTKRGFITVHLKGIPRKRYYEVHISKIIRAANGNKSIPVVTKRHDLKDQTSTPITKKTNVNQKEAVRENLRELRRTGKYGQLGMDK
mgnify:CR=1 FL=1